MPNPTRPVSGQVIDTAWGLAVADSVVRVYPNAATRDADLTGILPAELLGQACMLTDSGSLLVYYGSTLGWRPPWNTAWGVTGGPVINTTDYNLGGVTTVYNSIAAAPFVAGRRYAVLSEHCYVSDLRGYTYVQCDGASTLHRSPIQTLANGEDNVTLTMSYAASATRSGAVSLSGNTINFQGTKGLAQITVADVGPAVNPTALILRADTDLPELDLNALTAEERTVYDDQAELTAYADAVAKLDAADLYE